MRPQREERAEGIPRLWLVAVRLSVYFDARFLSCKIAPTVT